MNESANCNHTFPAITDRGRLTGSWIDVRTGKQIKIACKHCDKLYGYRSEEFVAQQDEYERRYREQLARQSCPGCGDKPIGL